MIKNGSFGLFFGDLVFTVSSFSVVTFDKYKRTDKIKYAEHAIISRKPVMEALHPELVEISMTMTFLDSLGTEPRAEAERLRKMLFDAEPNYLIIGSEAINESLFVLTEISEEVLYWDGYGKIMAANVTVKLKEYVEVGD